MKTQFSLARVKFGSFINDNQQNIFYGSAYMLDERNIDKEGLSDIGIGIQKLGIANEKIGSALRQKMLDAKGSFPVDVSVEVRLDGKEGEKSTLTIIQVF